MDGFSTYVLNYQDAAGNVFTTRVITNNPEPPYKARAVFDVVCQEAGYTILSADKIEEVAGTGEIAGEKPSWSARLYRGMVVAAVVLTIGNIGWDAYIYTKLAAAKEKAQADRTELREQLGRQERLLARIEDRQYRLGRDLDALERYHHRSTQ